MARREETDVMGQMAKTDCPVAKDYPDGQDLTANKDRQELTAMMATMARRGKTDLRIPQKISGTSSSCSPATTGSMRARYETCLSQGKQTARLYRATERYSHSQT